MLGDESLRGDLRFLATVRNIGLPNIVNRQGKNSLAYFSIRTQATTKMGMLSLRQLNQLRNFIDAKFYPNCLQSLLLAVTNEPIGASEIYFKKYYDLAKLTSKEIRTMRAEPNPHLYLQDRCDHAPGRSHKLGNPTKACNECQTQEHLTKSSPW